MIHVFFDTEFTDLVVDPQLISIGMIDETGERTFNAELSDTYRLDDVSYFAREAVLPQLEGGAIRLTMAELREQLRAWLKDLVLGMILYLDYDGVLHPEYVYR